MKVPIIVCLPGMDFLWWKNVFPDYFPLEKLIHFLLKEHKKLSGYGHRKV